MFLLTNSLQRYEENSSKDIVFIDIDEESNEGSELAERKEDTEIGDIQLDCVVSNFSFLTDGLLQLRWSFLAIGQ